MFSPECAIEPVLTTTGFRVNDRYPGVAAPPQESHAQGPRKTAVMPELQPTAIHVVRDGSVPRRLNIVIPTLLKENFSGGPNTALALGQVIADRGIPVNFVSTETAAEESSQVLHEHLALLTGIAKPKAAVTFTEGHDRSRPVVIGHSDIMLGTAWWTVHKFKHCLAELRTPRFVYLIQDFEPGLYPYSTKYALAAETYTLDHLPLYNHRFLYDFFKANRIGIFGGPPGAATPRGSTILDFLRPKPAPAAEGDGTWFDPVIDSRHFYFDEALRKQAGRTLLFYARPTVAVRNLYEIGSAALARLADEGTFDEAWKLYSMGENFGDVYLPRDKVLEGLPWMGLDDYGTRMRSCDVLLSLMLSPHPSYPPLEGAASGALVVTNEFANKTSAAFAALSANIIAVTPSIEGVTEGIRQAIARLDDHDARRRASRMSMPRGWTDALAGAADRVVAFWEKW
jgi:hypothetical protein